MDISNVAYISSTHTTPPEQKTYLSIMPNINLSQLSKVLRDICHCLNTIVGVLMVLADAIDEYVGNAEDLVAELNALSVPAPFNEEPVTEDEDGGRDEDDMEEV